jgi:hypothetical protein
MPRIIGNTPTDRWENEVLKAFKHQLPDDWVVMPSVKWTLMKDGYVRDGEADFIVLVPNSGLIVVEVKGSREFKVGHDGKWCRMDSKLGWARIAEPPPEQATRNMHDVTGFLNKKLGWQAFPGRFAYIVIYPQGRVDSLPATFDESTLATHKHINQLGSRLRNALEKRAAQSVGSAFTLPTIESIIDQLKNRQFHVQKADTSTDVEDDLGKIEQLTRQQYMTLKGLFQLQNVGVIGPAGSGKTVLAIWQLKALVDSGKRVIYVCYNRALAESLRLRNIDHSGFIYNVDRLFLDICPERQNMAGDTVFHREILPGLVIDKAISIDKYDAIIVDEGQDFSEEQVIALHDLLDGEGNWSFFADWEQDLYSANKGNLLGVDVRFSLDHNCRNTVKINAASNKYLNLHISSMPGMPIGVEPLVESTSNQALRAWELAKQWSSEGSVAILSPFKYENSAMNNQNSGHGLRLSTNIKDLGCKDTVFFSTIKSFKGIEAACVIVVDVCVPSEHPAFSKGDLYVACTRATVRLALISSKKGVAEYYK